MLVSEVGVERPLGFLIFEVPKPKNREIFETKEGGLVTCFRSIPVPIPIEVRCIRESLTDSTPKSVIFSHL